MIEMLFMSMTFEKIPGKGDRKGQQGKEGLSVIWRTCINMQDIDYRCNKGLYIMQPSSAMLKILNSKRGLISIHM